ncbi:MAG: Phosphoribosylanthranilate isomerase [Myxococcaceae bacterium]|nr:Phosphoribosylanthranilate isomerase [Myxococcaceae bacterium]
MAVRVKVCGVTSLADARACVEAGVDAIGLNFWSRSVRRCDETEARTIVQTLRGKTLFVGVFVDQPVAEIERLVREVGLDCVQLHGEEPSATVQHFLPHAYKALRVRGEEVLTEVRSFPGEYILLDAYVAGMPGGTGAVFDWQLAKQVALERKLTLAGGLTPDNVVEAVQAVRPWCVDTASGVESAPGVKDHELVRQFIARAKSA